MEKYLKCFNEYVAISARTISYQFARDGIDAVPLNSSISDDLPSTPRKEKLNHQEVIEIVLDNVPMPDDSVPWEDILDFRNDSDLKSYRTGLRTWMTDLVSKNLSPAEVRDKLEWSLFQQEQHLRLHKINSRRMTLSGIFVCSMELLEDLAKLRLGKLAQGIVELTKYKAQLLNAELSSPHKELNYMIRVREKFGQS